MALAQHFSILIHVVGHGSGVLAFGGFLVLLRRSPKESGLLPAAAAALALCWNAASLATLLVDPGGARLEAVSAFSMAVLSLLPCTLLHLALGGEHAWLHRAGYVLSTWAALIHALDAVGVSIADPDIGTAIISYGFSGLAIVSAVVLAHQGSRHRRTGMRVLAAMALLVFSVSFFHFRHEHSAVAWIHELLAHHAVIPLALFVLLQDYRFLLLDVFIRLAGAGALAASLAGLLLWAADSMHLLPADRVTAFGAAAFLGLTATAILVYPLVLSRATAWLENRLFRRRDPEEAIRSIHALEAGSEASFLEQSCKVIADFAAASRWELLESQAGLDLTRSEAAPGPFFDSLRPESRWWAEAVVPIRDRAGSTRPLLLGHRDGALRYLSADLADFDNLATEVAARLERIRMEEQRGLLRDAEMAALRAQINPHFLFNALNALNAILPSHAAEARRALLNLAEIFRYSLADKSQFVPLDQEIAIVRAYLEIEELRMGDRLSTSIRSDPLASGQMVPALCVQPLVENAVKHGVSPRAEGGRVQVTARPDGAMLRIVVIDDGGGFDPAAVAGGGHGLRSVERRLRLCYGRNMDFDIDSSSGGTRVRLSLPLAAED